MRMGFIGAGKVGISYGKYLRDKGMDIVGYYSKTYESSVKGANYTRTNAFKEIEKLIATVDIIFVTTPDDTIEEVSSMLSKTESLKAGQLVIHMSGAHSSDILKEVKERGCYTSSLHPLQAFADIDKAVADLPNTFFSIEGDDKGVEILTNIMHRCNTRYFILKGENKGLYHGAACVVSNYLVTLMDLGMRMLEAADINPMEGFEALMPLIEGSLNNIKNLGPVSALTGPVARGDVTTIKKHLYQLNEKLPEDLDFYKFLGSKTTKLANKEKLKDEKKTDHLNKLWKEERKNE